MYIKLRSINLHYYQETNDWVILGEILDSGMSYEKPILVRTTEELDIWFGKDFKDYSYMQELINMGVVLYLYKPVSNKTAGDDSYVDLDNYTEDDQVCLRNVETGWISKVLTEPERYKFRYNTVSEIKVVGFKINTTDNSLDIIEDVSEREFCTEEIVREELLNPVNQISEIYKSPIKFHVYNSENWWIYNNGEIIDIEFLPQNINLTSISGNNRDTVVISQPSDTLEYVYLDYNSEADEYEVLQNKDLVESLEDINQDYIGEIDPEKVATGYQTLMFRIEGGRIEEGDYFVIPGATHGTDFSEWRLIYSGTLSQLPKEVVDMFGLDQRIRITSFNDFIQKLQNNLGYTKVGNRIYSKTILPVTNFYKSNNIELIPETQITEAVLSRYVNPGIEAVSKTIGKSSEFEDDQIKLIIEEIGDKKYRVVITRYAYSETFEGTLNHIPGELRLDNLISQQSKIIRCNFYGDKLRTGTFYLRGARIEETTPEMYKYSLKKMLSTEYNNPVYPDYFLIPDKYKYTSDIIEDSPYQLFLEYSNEVGCQFLIENKSYSEFEVVTTINTILPVLEKFKYYRVENYYDWEKNHIEDPTIISKDSKIIVVSELPEDLKEGVYYCVETYYDWYKNKTIGDYIYNLTTDKENRLVYFFKPMTYKYAERPGYYAYLRGVLLNEFSISVKDILYRTPTNDAFLDYNIETTLKEYKSNYLVCDNQTYFYKDYQDGNQYISTGWTRFIIGKIFRELQKNSGEILGQQLLGVIRSKISDLISSISSGFSIVASISITGFEPENNGQSLKVNLETVMNDQIKNHVNLDITVNYNNNIYGTIS